MNFHEAKVDWNDNRIYDFEPFYDCLFLLYVSVAHRNRRECEAPKKTFFTHENWIVISYWKLHIAHSHIDFYLIASLLFAARNEKPTGFPKKTIHGHIEIRATFRAENVNYFLGSKNLNVEHRFLTYLIDDGRRSIFPQILHELWTTNRSLWQSNEIYLFWMVKERRLKKAK